MSQPANELPDSLRAKFPGMRPVKKAPVLSTVNGIGFTMYGKRDLDPETGTYIKTHVFCLVFIPVLAIGAYRVADAPKGWYFIGQERLSSFAKSCNWGVLCLSVMLAAILTERAYKSSPDYLARQELKRADAALVSGDAPGAARIYHEVSLGQAETTRARQGLRIALSQCLTNPAPEPVEYGFRVLAAIKEREGNAEAILLTAYQRGLEAIERFRQQPEGALAILQPVRKLGNPTNATLDALEVDLLKAAIAAKADNTNRVVQLALLYEAHQNLPGAIEVLTPYQHKLGTTEGARILGRHLLDQRKHEEAYQLLFPYVQTRLEHLHTVERNYTNATAAAYRRAIEFLDAGKADRSFYDKYEKASKDDQRVILSEFVHDWFQTDPGLQRAVKELQDANQIVHVTLDLGIVQLNRAQSLSDPAARRTELEAAEKTFLAIRGLAGDTDEFRMFLGQVYYWLGKSGQGKELFEQLLAANQRAYPLLIALGRTLREVGEEEQARALTEEAYQTAKTDEHRFQAASMRARIQKSVEDQIAWLEKSDPAELSIQTALNNARGEKALQDGDHEAAARFLRQAISGYEKLPQDSITLNNCSLAWMALFRVSGNVEDYTRGLKMLEQALALSPGNSVLLMNISHLFLSRAYMDVVGQAVRYDLLKETPDHGMLMHLYKDEASRVQVYEKLRQDEYLKKGLTYLDKALLLAPKNGYLYHAALSIHSGFHDVPEIEKLEQRMHLAVPDLARIRQRTLESYSGAQDKENLEQLQAGIKRYENLLMLDAVKNHEPTLNFAKLELIKLRYSASLLGLPADTKALVQEAKSLLARHDTSANHAYYSVGCFSLAHEELKSRLPAYAKLAEQTRRSLSPRQLIACILERDTDLARVLKSEPLVKQALQTVKEIGHRFPASRDIDEWAMFRTVDPQEASLVAGNCRDAKYAFLRDRMQFELNPLSAVAVLEQYWYRKLGGDQAGAEVVYREALANGVPLPPLFQ